VVLGLGLTGHGLPLALDNLSRAERFI